MEQLSGKQVAHNGAESMELYLTSKPLSNTAFNRYIELCKRGGKRPKKSIKDKYSKSI